jgi:hypothetical protein
MIRLKQLLREWTGETWTSCRQWASQRSKYIGSEEGVYVGTEISTSQFQLIYVGPSTGLSLAHAKGGSGDTLHQLFNVLICEINPWLANNKIRPNVAGITTECIAREAEYELIIQVPLETSDRTWQMNHRGGWGHDPGVGAIRSATPDSPDREIATEITVIPRGGKITTHFAVFPI